MKATVFHGSNDIPVEEVPRPHAGVGEAVIPDVGDGINDAPDMMAATVRMAIGQNSYVTVNMRNDSACVRSIGGADVAWWQHQSHVCRPKHNSIMPNRGNTGSTSSGSGSNTHEMGDPERPGWTIRSCRGATPIQDGSRFAAGA